MFLAGISTALGLGNDHGIVYADDFPGATATEQIDAALAALPEGKGLVIVPHTLGPGFATAIPAGKTVLDLRDDGQDSNFQIFTSNSATVPAFSIGDNGTIKLIRPTATTERGPHMGITGEAFERFAMTMDGSGNGRARSMLMRWGPGVDDRYLALGANLTTLSAVGTVSVTNEQAEVVGAGTAFTSDMVGQAFVVNADPNRIHRIASVSDATHLTLTTAWGGSTLSGQTYNIQTPAVSIDQDVFLETNNRYLKGRMAGGSATRVIGIDESDSVNMAGGGVRIFLADNRVEFQGEIQLAVNNKFLRGRLTGGTLVNLIGLDDADSINVAGGTMRIFAADNRMEYLGEVRIVTNNTFLRGKLTGGSIANLIGWDSSNSCNIAGGALRIFASDNHADFLEDVHIGGDLNLDSVNGDLPVWTSAGRNIITKTVSAARAALDVYSTSQVYTKSQVDALLSDKADKGTYSTSSAGEPAHTHDVTI